MGDANMGDIPADTGFDASVPLSPYVGGLKAATVPFVGRYLASESNDMLPPGTLVAAYNDSTAGDAAWILAKIVEWQPPKRVIVSDADNDDAQFTVSSNLIVPLVEDDDVASARARVGQKSKEVMAIYPETTSFYHAQIAGNPFRAGVEHGALANKICVTVTFDDDEDASGVLPRRIVQALHVFVVNK